MPGTREFDFNPLERNAASLARPSFWTETEFVRRDRTGLGHGG
jgi:hypothetical protein